MHRLHGVAYPTPPPPAGGAAPEAQPDDERAMALRFVRRGFIPPLPDEFADWYTHLLDKVRDGEHADTRVMIPPVILAMGYTFSGARTHTSATATATGLSLSLAEALRTFGRDDLLFSENDGTGGGQLGYVRASTTGIAALASTLVALGIRTTITPHRTAGTCTVQLSNEQAARLADHLIPPEGSIQEEFATALDLLDCLTERPGKNPCDLDRSGVCQTHGSEGAFNDGCAQPQAHALLIRHNIREQA